MRHWHFIFLTAAIVLILSSCGSRREKKWRVAFSQCTNDAWRVKMNADMEREVMLYDNMSLTTVSADGNSARQIADIEGFIREGVDLLIVSPNEAEAVTPIVESAYESGIPVIVADRKIFSDSFSAFVGADNYQIGQAVGLYVRGLLPHGGNVVELTGLMGSTPAIERHQGFVNVIKGFHGSGIRLLNSADAKWRTDTAYERMLELMNRYPRIDVLFAHNDIMAYGAYCAAKSMGREREMRIIGVDALPGKNGGVGLVADGILDATFIYPSGVEEIMRLASEILMGRQVPRETVLSTAIVNSANVKIMQLQEEQIDERQRKIELLNEKKADYENSISTQRTALFTSAAALLVILVLAAVLVFLLRRQHRLNRQLAQQNDKILEQKSSLEDQNRKMVDLTGQIEQATQSKLAFFTNVTHDLRTPLSLISGPVKQILDNPELPECDRETYLRIADKNIDVLSRLVSQILDFRKFENGRFSLNRTDVHLKGLVEGWNDSFMGLLRSKFIRFSFVCDPDVDCRVSIDVGRVESVYYNLLSNAFKFTPENGIIRVGLCTEEEGKFVRIKVFNSGSYIKEEDRKLIFDRFYQGSNGSAGSGSGIGLAVAKMIVEMHGGRISVNSSKEEGTTFYVDFPATGVAENSGDAGNVRVAEHGSGLFISDELQVVHTDEEGDGSDDYRVSVLVIDDNEDILSYVRMVLGKQFTVLTAENGQEGLDMAQRIIPDLIITDMMMPVMDGLECTSRLKSAVQTSHIPIIMLTAYSSDEHRLSGIRSGADAYVTKPFSAQVLRAMVCNLIENRNNLRKYFSENSMPARGEFTDIDRTFFEQFRKLVEDNMDNTELDVEQMGRMTGLSGVQLYRKVKAITGLAPKEYLRVARLKYADSLLSTTQLNINEIAYRSGFSSPNYFSKCYKEYFGHTPKSNRG